MNKIYYHNKITSVIQWDKPQGYNFQNAINPMHTVTSIPRRVSNSDQWEEHLDKNSGKIYYHNKLHIGVKKYNIFNSETMHVPVKTGKLLHRLMIKNILSFIREIFMALEGMSLTPRM